MEIACEGWLRKSPLEKRLFRNHKWEQRWFVLKQSGDIPGQYILDYYTDNTYKKLKGKVDLDQCKEVNVIHDTSKPDEHLFSIRTNKRTYYLGASSKQELNKWVQCICSVCSFKKQENVLPDLHGSSSSSMVVLSSYTSVTETHALNNQHSTSSSPSSSQNLRSKLNNQNSVQSGPPSLEESPRFWNNCATLQRDCLGTSSLSSHSGFSTLPTPPKRTSNSFGAYIPISECHTGKSIFQECPSKKTFCNEANKENQQNYASPCSRPNSASPSSGSSQSASLERVPNTNLSSLVQPSSSNSNDVNYDVPRQIKVYKKSKIKDLLNIVPTLSSPKSADEILYANAKSLPRNIGKDRESLLNYCNGMVSKNGVNYANTSAINESKSKLPEQSQPPPRPPKPSTLCKRSASLNRPMVVHDLLDQVPKTVSGPTPISPDLMYSIPKPTPMQKLSTLHGLDAIVPLHSTSHDSTLVQILPYTNAPPGLMEKPAISLMTYEYRPNLPVQSQPTQIPDRSSVRKSNSVQKSIFNGTLSESGIMPETPLTPCLAMDAYTSTPLRTPTSGETKNGAVFRFPESAAQLHDVFGPPIVNRQLKPKKILDNVAQKLPVSSEQANKVDLVKSLQFHSPPRIPSRGRQFLKKETESTFTRNSSTEKASIHALRTENLKMPYAAGDLEEIQYLDLDLDGENMSLHSTCVPEVITSHDNRDSDREFNSFNLSNSLKNSLNNSLNSFPASISQNSSTVYKTVDFVKTKAFNELRDGLNRKPQE